MKNLIKRKNEAKSMAKIVLVAFIIVATSIILLPTKVNAALQANGGTPASYIINSWLLAIRQMQTTGGALGLTDTINGNLTSGNTNLDIHMEKNTEYGAMAILSASSYGMGSTPIKSGETTTGNATGIKIMINSERVSAGDNSLGAFSTGSVYVPNFRNALGRYKNIYTENKYVEKVGDGIATVGAWHGASGNKWIDNKYPSGLLRARSGSLFSYYGYGSMGGSDYGESYYGKKNPTRAVVVVGSGI